MSRRGGGSVATTTVENDAALRQKLITSLRNEKQYHKVAPPPNRYLSFLEYGVIAVIIVILFGLLFGLAVPASVYVSTTPGGNTAALAQTAFVDPRGLALFLQTMATLTSECQPPPNSPALSIATVGTRERTTAGWQAIMAAVAGNVTNGTGCQFYGLLAAEARVGRLMGPADMCQAYVNIGIDLIGALYGFHMPANISTLLNAAFFATYPLNIFWLNTNNPLAMQQQVVARAYEIVVCLTQPGTQCTARPIDVQGIATQFCNPFFASDDLSYYGQAFMPWLKFPFPGLIPRDGENVYAPQVRRLVSPQTLAALLQNGTFVDGNVTVVAAYILGDVAATEPEIALALDSSLGPSRATIRPRGPPRRPSFWRRCPTTCSRWTAARRLWWWRGMRSPSTSSTRSTLSRQPPRCRRRSFSCSATPSGPPTGLSRPPAIWGWCRWKSRTMRRLRRS